MEPQATEIRVLREPDAAAWWHLRLESLESEPFAFGSSAEEHRGSMTIETVEQRFRSAPASSIYLGAFDGGALVGMATFIREAGLKERHKGRIYGVYVRAARRRIGVGRGLLAALLERAVRDASLEQVRLAVSSSAHAAQRLYRSLGFEPYGTEPNALKIGSSYIDEDHMILRIRRVESPGPQFLAKPNDGRWNARPSLRNDLL